MEQAKFLGWKNQKTVSVDWVTAYAAPFRATVGTTVSDTKDPASGTDTSTASDNVMARFTQGGDVYTTIAYPLFACTTMGGDDKTPIPRFYVIAFPRLGMVTPALGTNVPTEVTEFNFDLGAELYADWGTPQQTPIRLA